MEDFWTIVSNWHGFGQFLFFLLIIAMVVGTLRNLCYYFVVVVRGWPPEHAAQVEIASHMSSEEDE